MVDSPSETGPMFAWSKVEVIPGAKPLLLRLNEFVECSLATNAKDSSECDIRKTLDRAGIGAQIKNVFCYQSTGFKKPSKDFFQFISEFLKINSQEVVMVGDDLK